VSCHCPELPSPELRDTVPAGPILCHCCGKPLQLTCPGCGPSTVDASIAAAFPPKSEPDKQKRAYAMKPCVGCSQPFQPTGPSSTKCERCKQGTEVSAHGV
jgi:hypothetical protein